MTKLAGPETRIARRTITGMISLVFIVLVRSLTAEVSRVGNNSIT